MTSPEVQRQLQELLRLPENQTCADCGAFKPSWASINLGVFFCLDCSAHHRAMGTHISKVKSCTLDTWDESMIRSMQKAKHNANANQFYEKYLPPSFKRPQTSEERNVFIRQKYEQKLFQKPLPSSSSSTPAPAVVSNMIPIQSSSSASASVATNIRPRRRPPPPMEERSSEPLPTTSAATTTTPSIPIPSTSSIATTPAASSSSLLAPRKVNGLQQDVDVLEAAYAAAHQELLALGTVPLSIAQDWAQALDGVKHRMVKLGQEWKRLEHAAALESPNSNEQDKLDIAQLRRRIMKLGEGARLPESKPLEEESLLNF